MIIQILIVNTDEVDSTNRIVYDNDPDELEL